MNKQLAVAVGTLAVQISKEYLEPKLVEFLKENDHEILQDISQQVLNEEGFPEWVKLADVEYVIHLKNNYDFEEWAELANAMFHLENVKDFLEHDMYVMFLEFIELFDIKLTIKTEKSELKEAW